MKLSVPHCPECGEQAVGTLDLVLGLAQFTDVDDEGNVDWEGYTEMDWDNQETTKGENGKSLVRCSNYHEWETDIEE